MRKQNNPNANGVRKAAISNEPVRYGKLFVYPLTVADYELLVGAESALTLRLSSLPAIYAAKSYAAALYKIAYGRKPVIGQNGTVSPDEFWKFISLLAASLRLPLVAISNQIKIIVDEKDNSELKSIVVWQTAENEQNVQQLSLSDLSSLREIIAEMNGRTLPDESENLELVQAEEDIRTQSALGLDVNFESLLASVARDQRCRIKDLYGWSILEFELIRAAIERERRFTVFGIGECSGFVKFNGGNPYPSVFYDKPAKPSAVVKVSDMQHRFNGAIASTSKLPDLPVIGR